MEPDKNKFYRMYAEDVKGVTQLMLDLWNNEFDIDTWKKRNMGRDYINRANSEGWTALHIALAKGTTDVDAVKFLLENGADPNLKTYNERTSLDLAKSFKDEDITYKLTKLLLKYGAEIPQTCDLSLSFLCRAVHKFINLKRKNKKLNYEIKELRQEINKLETHIACMPDGPAYLDAKDRFENNKY